MRAPPGARPLPRARARGDRPATRGTGRRVARSVPLGPIPSPCPLPGSPRPWFPRPHSPTGKGTSLPGLGRRGGSLLPGPVQAAPAQGIARAHVRKAAQAHPAADSAGRRLDRAGPGTGSGRPAPAPCGFTPAPVLRRTRGSASPSSPVRAGLGSSAARPHRTAFEPPAASARCGPSSQRGGPGGAGRGQCDRVPRAPRRSPAGSELTGPPALCPGAPGRCPGSRPAGKGTPQGLTRGTGHLVHLRKTHFLG